MKIILINSHLYSGSSILSQALTRHPLIQECKASGMKSGSYLTDYDLTNIFFKKKGRVLYLDEILFNQNLSTRLNYKNIFIINFVRRPKETLESLIGIAKMQPNFALRYYQYRLNRMYQISKKANKCLFLKFESLKDNGLNDALNFIGLEGDIRLSKKAAESFDRQFNKDLVPRDLLSIAERRYENYHWLLSKNQLAD